MKECLLISACFLGRRCKYNGGHNALPEELLRALAERYRLIPVCPETAGGLPVPREPSERLGERVISRSGADVTEAYAQGAACAVSLARRFGCRKALLKERSPSCGAGQIYDGSFSGRLVPGFGTAAEALLAEGLSLYGESSLQDLLKTDP